ncbi:MAG: phosphorylase [Bacteroidota bacterium]|nr:hypothetical protein [Kiloniellaceae bacterium]
MGSPRLGIVTGLASEAVIATALIGEEDFPARVLCAGASSQRASVQARQLVDLGVEALLSFGLAGALDPALTSGDLVVALQVRNDGGELHPCDAGWQEALHAALVETQTPCRRGGILGSARLWRRPADKRSLFAATDCLAVDMESGAVAAVAAEAGLPFLAVRAIADRADDALPALVEHAVKPDGMPAVGRTLAAMLKSPTQIPSTLRLARRSNLALASLRRLDVVRDELLGGF